MKKIVDASITSKMRLFNKQERFYVKHEMNNNLLK